ncbi:hypothetical protein AMJ40_04665 [candidate division TA06 bacterium DG_26]|uniref:Dockerin domain-containing protein n=1 Tax=candidate division TA06 bacterium DG_26 TaxID=1703771 RepID=A0A0S7WI64_UNCT6|nr:MAG: hypothetical protein AMJ40_04665 [candidate division TA06 bacterium DG_26]
MEDLPEPYGKEFYAWFWKVLAADGHGGSTWSSGVFGFSVQWYGCGDPNGDERVSVSDAIYLVDYLYRGGLDPKGDADVNVDGTVTTADAIYIVTYVYRNGPPPCEPAVPSRKHRARK